MTDADPPPWAHRYYERNGTSYRETRQPDGTILREQWVPARTTPLYDVVAIKTVSTMAYGSYDSPTTVATELPRKAAAKLAGALLRSPQCDGVRLVAKMVGGKWVRLEGEGG